MQVLNFYHIGKVIPDGAIYVERANAQYNLAHSKFANPFPVTKNCSRQESIDKYRFWLYEQLKIGNITKQDILSLEGKNLVCYCSPLPCHSNVLINAFNYIRDNPDFLKKEVKSCQQK